MAKKEGATREGGPKMPEFVETERYNEIESLAEAEKAGLGEDGLEPLKPGEDGDIPLEVLENDNPDDEKKPKEGEDDPEKPDGEVKPDEADPDKPDTDPDKPKPDDLPPEEDFDTLIVDGAETKTEKAKIYEAGKQALQKTLFADKKMQEATEKAKEADRILTEARKKAEELAKPPEKKEPEKKDDDTALSEDEITAIVDNIRYGDAEQTKEAVLKLVKGAKATQKPQDVTPIIDKRFDELYDKRTAIQAFKSALEQAKLPPEQGGFGDVFDGEAREKVFEYYEGKIAKDEPTLSYSERFKKAGEATRKALNLNPTKPGSPESDLRQQRKAELENSPTPASPGSAKPAPKPVKTEFEHHNQLLSDLQKERRGR